jgi:p-cumate 2,3-dioxygenase alpha subunit
MQAEAATAVEVSGYKSRFLDIDPSRGRFRVSRRTFTDPVLFAEEERKILQRSWLMVGHESEIPKPNDFIVRKVLEKTLIFCRSRDGKVRAFLNTCPHRGAAVCRERRGNRRTFTCGYHGWVFRNSGELADQASQDGYPAQFNDDGAYNLFTFPNLASRGGFYFVNFDPRAEPLDEFLAGAGEMIDLLAEQSDKGLQVIQGCHEYSIRANYKLLCENSMDGYHLWATHASYVEFLAAQHKGAPVPAIGGGFSLGRGHGVLEMNVGAGRTVGQWLPAWGEEARIEIEAKKASLVARLGPERADRIANFNRMMTIFPNTVINDQHAIQVRSIYPIGHDQLQVRAWVFGPADESPLLRKIRVDNALSFLGPAGFGTPDDAEILEQAQEGYAMGSIEWNDISNGLRRDSAPGVGRGKWDGEVQMRSYWMEYDRLMERGR